MCGKAFNSRDNRNAHRFVHSDKKPYECLVCGMGFMRKPLLYNHMNQAGHQNDTIVVNQPRLTTDEVKANKVKTTAVVTAAPAAVQTQQLEMTLITDADGNQKLVQTNLLVCVNVQVVIITRNRLSARVRLIKVGITHSASRC